MIRGNQSGSVLSFIVVGGVLTLLLVGGVYFVRQQMMPKSQLTTQEPASKPQQSSDTSNHGTSQTATNNQTGTQNSKTAVPPSDASKTATELPHTGIAETVSTLFAVALLCASITAYVQSRRSTATLT